MSLTPDKYKRLEALNQYQILDTRLEEAFDQLTELASLICEPPISLVSLLDDQRQGGISCISSDSQYLIHVYGYC
ncbi:hypothetical protein GCM10028773_63990 [Spirosoma koreense]